VAHESAKKTYSKTANETVRNAAPLAKLVLGEELEVMKVQKKPHLIEGILSAEGGTVLAADAKTGKSTLALEMCVSVCRGQHFLGAFATQQGGCVYWMADDLNVGRFALNYKQLSQGRPVPHFAAIIERRALVPDGLLMLEAAITQMKAAMVVIDCLTAVRTRRQAGEDFVASEYNELSMLNAFAAKHHLAVLLQHHMATTAHASKNIFNAMAGSFAIGGAPDDMLALQTFTRTRTERLLLMQGRDVDCVPVVYARGEDGRLFHVATGPLADVWEEAYRLYLGLGEAESMTTKEIAEAMGVTDRAGRYKAATLRQAGVLTEIASRRYGWERGLLRTLQQVKTINSKSW